jgi:hypothetical protein
MRSLIDLANSLKAFFARTDNPHEVTAAQVDAYDKAYYDNLAIESLIPMDRIPLTRFGNLLWLPINISGSFEGATRTEASWFNAINVEDDGTPVMLVNSTNGVRESVYFSYLGLSESKQIISHTPVATEYRPAFLQANETIRNVNGCSAKTAVWGVLAGNDEFDSWICLTGGTLNPAVHVGARFKRPDELAGQWGVSFASGQYAYIMMPRGDHCSIAVWRCPIIDIQTKASVVFEKVKGIKTYGARSEYTDDNIRVGTVAYSKNEADKPVFLITGEGFNPPGDQRQLWGDVSLDDGSIWMRSLHVGQIRYGNTNVGVGLGYTVKYDPIENVARLVPNQYGGFNIDPKNEAPGWTISRRGVNISQYDLNFAATGQPHDSAAIGTNGQIIKVNYANENAGNVQSFTIEKFNSHWEAWDFMQTKVTGINTKALIRQYPGSFGDSARCTHILGLNKLGVYSVANHPTDPFARLNTFSVTNYTDPDFDYNTVRLGDIKGYQPKSRSDKHSSVQIGHCEYVSYPAYTMHVGGGRLWENKRKNYVAVSEDLVYTKEVSVPDNLWDELKLKLVELAPEVSRVSTYPRWLELQIFDNPTLPCIGTLHIFHNDGARQCHRMMFSFTPDVREGEVTSITLGHIWYSAIAGDTSSLVWRGKENFVPATVFYNRDENFTVVSFNSMCSLQQSGSQPSLMCTLMLLDGASEYRTDWVKLDNGNPWYFGFHHYGTIPRLGFGQYDMTANRGLSGTGIVFRVIGTSKADIERYSGDRQVMVMSQQAPVGWFAFISEPVPCLMGGKYAEVPAATLALEDYDPDPANKRFNIYVVLKDGTFSYELDQGERPETLTSCWVGFIETGAINVTRLWIEKVNRIDIYRLSEGQIGSAIPIVPGSPLGAGTLDWVKNA